MGASNAWAETETTELLNIDYSTTTTPAWTVVGGSGSITDGSWVHEQGGGNGPRSAYLDFGLNSSIDDNWSASFDLIIKTGSTWTQASKIQYAIAATGATYPADSNNSFLSSNVLFGARLETTRSNMGTDLAFTITLNDVDEAETVTLSHNTTYTFNVSVNGTSLTASIMNGTTEVYSGAATLAAFVKPRGIFDLLPRPYNATWGVYSSTYDNIVVTKEVEAGSVEVPSAQITGVDGIKRTVSFTCATDGVDFSYSTDNGETFTDGNSVEISATTSIIVKATKGGNSATSEAMEFEAGTEITLNTPTWSKSAYSAGVSTVTLNSDQSSKLLSPNATIKYKINDGETQTFGSDISVNDGETLTYWAEANGYTNSAEGSVNAVAPCTYPTIISDTYYSSDNNAGITLGDEATEIGGTTYKYMIASEATISDNIVTSSAKADNDYWLYRNGGIYSGVGKSYAVLGVQNGDYVTITFQKGDGAPVVNTTDATYDEWNSTTTSSVYCVTGTTGVVRFSIARYGYIKSISIQRNYPTLASGDAVKLTFNNATSGTNAWENWIIDVYNGGNKVAKVRADWWDDIAATNNLFTYGYTYSSDGGTTADNTDWSSTFMTDMADADVDLTMSYSEGSLYIIGTVTSGNKVYYVNYTKSGLDGEVSYDLYGNNATLSNITTTAASVTTTPVHPTNVAVTLGTNGYTTYANNVYPLDLTSAKAYKAAVDGSKVNFTLFGQAVPVSTGMLVEGEASGTVNLPIADASTDVSDNEFLVNASGATFDAEDNTTYYAMKKDSDPLKFGTFAPGTLAFPATKAYLKVATGGAKALTAFFGDDVTGISQVENAAQKTDDSVYNIAGQRVSKPTKGLYIVNGKKVMVK